jgi:hypothetical protein
MSFNDTDGVGKLAGFDFVSPASTTDAAGLHSTKEPKLHIPRGMNSMLIESLVAGYPVSWLTQKQNEDRLFCNALRLR